MTVGYPLVDSPPPTERLFKRQTIVFFNVGETVSAALALAEAHKTPLGN